MLRLHPHNFCTVAFPSVFIKSNSKKIWSFHKNSFLYISTKIVNINPHHHKKVSQPKKKNADKALYKDQKNENLQLQKNLLESQKFQPFFIWSQSRVLILLSDDMTCFLHVIWSVIVTMSRIKYECYIRADKMLCHPQTPLACYITTFFVYLKNIKWESLFSHFVDNAGEIN